MLFLSSGVSPGPYSAERRYLGTELPRGRGSQYRPYYPRGEKRGQRDSSQAKEYALLEYLARNTGKVVSKTMIMEHVWDYNFDPMTNVVEARVCKLRDKIDKDYDTKLLHTVWGAGYVLKENS